MKTSTLKPGYLVSLKTSLRGGVTYDRVDLERDHVNENGERIAEWQTKRAIADPVEYENAVKVRGKARSIIAAVCSKTSFGLLCPLDRAPELTEAIKDARVITDAHNTTAGVTRVDVYVLIGEVAQSDVEAARAIASEVRGLLDDMRDGIAKADPQAIRDAANRARSVGQMLSADVSEKINEAIKQARTAARAIVKQVEGAGESAAEVVATLNVEKIDQARFAFLDMDDTQQEVTSIAPHVAPVEMLDLEDKTQIQVQSFPEEAADRRVIEMEGGE